MEQDDLVPVDKEKGSRDPGGKTSSHLPEAAAEIAHERHSERPAELHGFDIFADHFPFSGRQLFEPDTDWFHAGLGGEENDGKRSRRHGHRKSTCITKDTVSTGVSSFADNHPLPRRGPSPYIAMGFAPEW